MLFKKPKAPSFQTELEGLFFLSKYALIYMTTSYSYFQDGGHDVISLCRLPYSDRFVQQAG